nr:hypothetical protein [Candidatus Freyarchaeota archaeon]
MCLLNCFGKPGDRAGEESLPKGKRNNRAAADNSIYKFVNQALT